jgi:hypothetical protein
MIKQNISSVPVLQQTKNLYYGYLDIADIVGYFVNFFGEAQLKDSKDFWALVNRTEEVCVSLLLRLFFFFSGVCAWSSAHAVRGGSLLTPRTTRILLFCFVLVWLVLVCGFSYANVSVCSSARKR